MSTSTPALIAADLSFEQDGGSIEIYGPADARGLCDFIGRIDLHTGAFTDSRGRGAFYLPSDVLSDETKCREYIARRCQGA